jgi:hypothetical protein
LARLDPDLKPGREKQLRVVKEDLRIVFGVDLFGGKDATTPPLAVVTAEYTIENPTPGEVSVDFGFPILRGIYVQPPSMARPPPAVKVIAQRMDSGGGTPPKTLPATLISNSNIYGLIRARSREAIEKAIAGDEVLSGLVLKARGPGERDREALQQAMRKHLTEELRWNERDATLMVEYASLEFGEGKSFPPDRNGRFRFDGGLSPDPQSDGLVVGNLGPLSAIGEQKATQFFAQLASRFDPGAGAAYEAIFKAWGGDVREMSVDLKTGQVRPREITVDPKSLTDRRRPLASIDATVYARVDYLDPGARISEAEKSSCQEILKNLPVIFTFAPMNLLHYSVTFDAHSINSLMVSYRQYAYQDTKPPASYQLAYVVHPASFWDSFGPINLKVIVPQGVTFRASVPCLNGWTDESVMIWGAEGDSKVPCSAYEAVLKDKTGELFVAVDAEEWKKALARRPEPKKGQETSQVSVP